MAFVLQRFVNRHDFALAADHSNVARLGSNRPRQYPHVLFMSPGHDHEITRRVRPDLLQRIFVTRKNFQRRREALFVRKGFAIVHHGNAKSRGMRRLRHRHRDVPAAKQINYRLRQNRLDENFQRPAANQSVVVARFIIQVEDHLSRCFLLHHFFRGCPDFGLYASAPDGSRHRAVFVHQHPRTLITRNRAVRVHDGSQRAALPSAPHLYDFFKQVHRLPPLSAYGEPFALSMRVTFWTLPVGDDTVPFLRLIQRRHESYRLSSARWAGSTEM